MTKSYKLKVFANKKKIKELNKLVTFWRDKSLFQCQKIIDINLQLCY